MTNEANADSDENIIKYTLQTDMAKTYIHMSVLAPSNIVLNVVIYG